MSQQRVFAPAFTANYPSDVRHMVGEIKGPNLMGEVFRAKSAVFDEKTGRTRVEFELLRAAEVRQLADMAAAA